MGHKYGRGYYGKGFYGRGAGFELTKGFDEAKKPSSQWACIVELSLDTGLLKFSNRPTKFEDVRPMLKNSPRALPSKIEIRYDKSSVGKVSFDLLEPEYFRKLIANEYLKNRKVEVKIGPLDGHYSDYFTYFKGKVKTYDIAKDVMRISVEDEWQLTREKIPTLNETKTQFVSFGAPIEGADATSSGMHPLVIMERLLEIAGIESPYIDSEQFSAERRHFNTNWRFQRIINKPMPLKTLINDLQEITLTHLFQKYDQVSVRTFAPPLIGQSLLSIDEEFIQGSFSLKGKQKDNFFNRIEVYYDYDEAADELDNYHSVKIVEDLDSQGATQWNEVKTKTIKSKWMKSLGVIQGNDLNEETGFVVLFASSACTTGLHTIRYTTGDTPTLEFRALGSSTFGEAIKVKKPEIYTIPDGEDDSKFITVLCIPDLYSGNTRTDDFRTEDLDGDALARILAKRLLNEFRDPVPEIDFKLPLHKLTHLGDFVTPSQIVKVSTDLGAWKGYDQLQNAYAMLLSVKPDFKNFRGAISAIITMLDKKFLHFSPNRLHQVDWADEDAEDQEYGAICDNNNEMTDPVKSEGYRIL